MALLTASVRASAQSESDLSFWNENLRRSSLADIARQFRDTKAPKWPRIESKHAYEEVAGIQLKSGPELLELAERLRSRLHSSFQPDAKIDNAELTTQLDDYASIAAALRGAGGYSNLVLQDTVGRLMIFRLSGWLIENPTETRQAEALFEKVEIPRVNLNTLVAQLRNQDRALARMPQDVMPTAEAKSIYQAFTPIGLKMADVLAFNDPEKVKTSVLLKDAAVPALAYRMATTEALKSVHLRGLIRFLKAGGSLTELDPADIRNFEKRMGQEAKSFNYPLLEIRH